MSKIYNLYENKLDKAWYNSSNVLYSECEDIENDYKILTIVFNSGKAYKYKNVDVNDYLLFRESNSQGKSFSSLIKKYEYEKIEDRDVDKIKEELDYYTNNILLYKDKIIINGEILPFNDNIFNMLSIVLNKLNLNFKSYE